MFGKKISYMYGDIHRDVFLNGTDSYKICEEDLKIIKTLNRDNLRLFGTIDDEKNLKIFNNECKILNTYIIDEDDDKFIWFSLNNKRIISKIYENAKRNKFYVCKIVNETEEEIEIEILKYEDKFLLPGTFIHGKVNYKGQKPYITTELGEGEIILQTNEVYVDKEVFAVLIKLSGEKKVFAEVYNPVKSTQVNVIKTINNLHFVENGNIRGVIAESENSKEKDVLNVKVKNIRMGSYEFELSRILIDVYQYFKIINYCKQEDVYYVKTVKTNEKLKARILGKGFSKTFGGKIVEFIEEELLYIIDTNIGEKEVKEISMEVSNAEEIEDIRKEWNLSVFAKYDHLLQTNVNVLKMKLDFYNEKSFLEVDEFKKYINRFIRKEKSLKVIVEVKNKNLLKYLFYKLKSMCVFEKLMEVCELSEILQDGLLKKFYFEKLVSEEKYNEAIDIYGRDNLEILCNRITKKSHRIKFEEFLNNINK